MSDTKEDHARNRWHDEQSARKDVFAEFLHKAKTVEEIRQLLAVEAERKFDQANKEHEY